MKNTFTFDDVLAVQRCMETVKKVQEDEALYNELSILHDKLYDACHEEPINEEELDRLTDELNPNDPHGDTYEIGLYFGFQDGFKAGYHKTLENNISMIVLKAKQWLKENIIAYINVDYRGPVEWERITLDKDFDQDFEESMLEV